MSLESSGTGKIEAYIIYLNMYLRNSNNFCAINESDYSGGKPNKKYYGQNSKMGW